MADDRASIKDEDTYDALREQGASKEKAARIANARAGGGEPSKKGGEAANYEERTKEQLYERAQELDIEGRSDISKNELIDALRNH
ncbi:MAG: Rho termination factor [Pseudomonadota bacterium]